MINEHKPGVEKAQISPAELQSRWERLQTIMANKDLDAILIVGNSAVGPPSFGSFRYFTSHKVYYGYQAIVARPGKPVMVCATSVLHKKALTLKGFTDIRISPDIQGSVSSTLNEQPLRRIGLSLDILPSSWYLMLEEMSVEFVDITEDIIEARNERTEFELRAARESARISDAGYKAMLDMARPGVMMSDLHAELDYVMKMEGAEETFILMSNGRFSLHDNHLPCIRPFSWPDDRVIKHGDCVAMEITPRYNGYWTQMVRTFCVGEENPDMAIVHKAQIETIASTVPLLVPGVTLEDVSTHIRDFSETLGFISILPFCHLAGLDLDEGWHYSAVSGVALKANMTFVLHPTLVTKDIDYGIFWGESYLVTGEGGICFTSSGNEFATV